MIETLKVDKYDRFFAGIPNIPKKNKSGMAIYETFIQHILASMEEDGKSAIVVPTGFTTATSPKIPENIRKELIDNNWLRGVIHMPSNIFATTGTSVSIIFIDKSKADDKVILMDASNLGKTVKLDEGQRTVLTDEEKEKIIVFFKERKEEPEFSVLVSNEDIKENNYQIQAGQYVELKEEELDFDINDRLEELCKNILENMAESEKIGFQIKEFLKGGGF